ncbi:DUF429 domain-containing protein [Cerasicoccus frondis]|uniref:DUF429 domain-containing protein n=1 Tax=Cerasicoccus frondis TaxID=490090 RepID=UPI0028525D23|nr:DUF429 domain-containing protein [Cerasicoccus frondis]
MHTLGIDGCKGGWIAVEIDDNGNGSIGLFDTVYRALIMHPTCDVMLIDMPIGLPDALQPTRECDAIARKLLGKGMSSRVFSPPPRRALDTSFYEDACALSETIIGKKISRQSFNIAPKIKELDGVLRRHRDYVGRLREAHPELAFASMNNRKALQISKKQKAGQQGRLKVLQRHYPHARDLYNYALDATQRKDVARDDILDAMALAIMARSARKLRPIPADPPSDAVGLPMEIVVGVYGWETESATRAPFGFTRAPATRQ